MVWIPDGKKISKISLFVLTECTHRAVKMLVAYCEIYNSFLVNFSLGLRDNGTGPDLSSRSLVYF